MCCGAGLALNKLQESTQRDLALMKAELVQLMAADGVEAPGDAGRLQAPAAAVAGAQANGVAGQPAGAAPRSGADIAALG